MLKHFAARMTGSLPHRLLHVDSERVDRVVKGGEEDAAAGYFSVLIRGQTRLLHTCERLRRQDSMTLAGQLRCLGD
jgi:hypothetical protein